MEWLTESQSLSVADLLKKPIRFSEALEKALGSKPATLVEVGPSRSLWSASRDYHKLAGRSLASLMPRKGVSSGFAHALQTLGKLWETGIQLDFVADSDARRVSLPGVSFDRQKVWLDENRSPTNPDHEIAPKQEAPHILANALEKQNDIRVSPLTRIWCDLLGSDCVRDTDDFFLLGGDSLLASQLCGLVKDRLGIELSPKHVFDFPTFGELAKYLHAFRNPSLCTDSSPEASAISKQDPPDLPLSVQQQGLWLGSRMDHSGSALNLPVSLKIQGPVDRERLEGALRTVLGRHRLLLHNFEQRDDRLIQAVRHIPAEFTLKALTLDPSKLEEYVQGEADRPFSTSDDLLLRGTLLTVGSDQHVLLVTAHHLVADGWSLLAILREMTAIYSGAEKLQPPVPYSDYVEQQATDLATDTVKKKVAAARARFKEFIPVEVHADHQRLSIIDDEARSLSVNLGVYLATAVRKACAINNTTLFVYLLAAFQSVVRIFAGQEDVAIVAPLANRGSSKYRETVGPMVNLAVFPNHISLEEPFRSIVARVRDELVRGLENEDIPFESQIESRRSGMDSLFRTGFSLNHVLPRRVSLGDAAFAIPAMISRRRSRYDLMMWIDEEEGDIRCTLEYRYALYEEATISRLLTTYKTILQAASRNSSESLASMSLVSDIDRDRIEHWNETAIARPKWHAVQFEIARVAEVEPHRVAMSCGGEVVTYRELDAEARRIATVLLDRGVSPEEPVGVHLSRGPRLITSIIGILYAGGAYLPLEPSLPALRIKQMLNGSSARRLITEQGLGALGNDLDLISPHESHSESVVDLPRPVDPKGLAYVLYTSGSSGQPKGVMVSHDALANRLDWMISAFGVGVEDRILQKTPISFDVSLWEIFLPLIAGGTLVIAKPDGHKDPAYLSKVIAGERVTIIHFVPSMLKLFLDQEAPIDLTSLRFLVCSGEALDAQLCERTGHHLRQTQRLVNLYGPTEAAIDVSSWSWLGSSPTTIAPIGRPIQNLRLYVLDSGMRHTPIGVKGELYIGGVGLGRGYIGAPDLTADRFVPDPFSHGGRLYRTGDAARWLSEGNLEFLGRLDSQVKLRGFRIELEEVAQVLRENEFVEDAAISIAGAEGVERLVAHVVPHRALGATIRRSLHLAETLPAGFSPCVLSNGLFVAIPQGRPEWIQEAERTLQHSDGRLPVLSRDTAVIDFGGGGGLIGICTVAASPSAGPLFVRSNEIAQLLMAAYAIQTEVLKCEDGEELKQLLRTRDISRIGLLRLGADLDAKAFLDHIGTALLAHTACVQIEFPQATIPAWALHRLEAEGFTVAHQSGSGWAILSGMRPELGIVMSSAISGSMWDGATLKERLRVFASARLPEYMVPQEIVLIDRMPVTNNGKLDRGSLPGKDPWRTRERSRTEPTSPLEKALAEIWAKILGPEAHSFLESDFFENGGNSLAAVRLISAIERRLGVRLELTQLFDSPTLGSIAKLVEGQPKSTTFELTCRPADRYQPFQMTEIQQAYWLGSTSAFQLGNISTRGYLEIEAGDLDIEHFRRALNELIARHDMLRAVSRTASMLQVLEEVPIYSPEYSDLCSLASDARTKAVEEIRQEMGARSYDPEHWPAFEVRVTRLSPARHIIHFSIDALTIDGASVLILERDLNVLYRAASGERPEPRRASLSFRDFAVAKSAMRDGSEYRRARAYWLRRMNDLPEPPNLLTRPLRVRQSMFRRRHTELGAAQWTQLRARMQTFGLTEAAVLLTAYAEVLARWSGAEHFLLNLPIFNRPPVHPEIDQIVGNFTSTLLLEVDFRGLGVFHERARRLHRQLWADLSNSIFDGIELQRVRGRQRRDFREARAPIVFTGLIGLLGREAGAQQKIFDLNKEAFGVAQTPQVLLDCVAIERADGLTLNWDAVEEAFPPGMLDEMFHCMDHRLRALATRGDEWVSDLETAPPRWRHPRIASQPALAPTTTLVGPVLAAAKKSPDAVAIVSETATLTYEELCELAGGVSAELLDRGVSRGDLVGILADRGWEQVVAMLGANMAGTAYLPIESTLPLERQRKIIAVGGVRTIVAQAGLPIDFGNLTVVEVKRNGPRRLPPPIELKSDDLAYVIFTSGSTGEPKGVAVEHGAAANTISDINQKFGVQAGDAVIAISGMGFDLSVYDVYGLLAAGAKIVMPHPKRHLDASHWSELISKQAVTIWNSTPSLYEHLISEIESTGRGEDLRSLRLAMLSGDWIPLDLPDRARLQNPRTLVVSLGGATEGSIWSICFPIDDIDPQWNSIPYGKPLCGQDVVVLDKHLAHCPTWVAGDIYIAGGGLARGYWLDPQQTANAFFEHPAWHIRLYRTGDRGRYLPDGNIEFLGRTDTQVKVGGLRLELGEVERILEAHPGVDRAVVVADRAGGREIQRLAACVVLGPRAIAEEAAINVSAAKNAIGSWQAAVESGREAGTQIEELRDPQSFLLALQHLELEYANALVGLFNRLGRQAVGTEINVDDLIYEEGFAPRYRKWVLRAMEYLVQRNVARRLALGRYKTISAISELRDTAVSTPEIALERVLREEIHSAEIYTGDAVAANYQAYYNDCYKIAAKFIASFVEKRQLDGEAFRIFEIGSGYGSLTQRILPLLKGALYAFTDISPFFLNRAKDVFEQFPFVTYHHYDMNAGPELQGIERGKTDLVIAASVLHNAHDIQATLRHLRSLLAPGGAILFVEETKFFPFFNLGMGLQQGFDEFNDAVREEHPLLSREEWFKVLAEAGFEEPVLFARERSATELLHFDVMVARTPFHSRALNISGLKNHVEKFLPRVAIPSLWLQIEEVPLTSNGKVNRSALRLPEPRLNEYRPYLAPRDPVEEALAEIWAKALGLPRVGVQDDFFELGGDSLIASRIAAEVRSRLELDVQLQALFDATTVEELAAILNAAKKIHHIPGQTTVTGEL